AAVLHFGAALSGLTAPSVLAMRSLTAGALVMTAVLLILRPKETRGRKAILAAALLIFAFSGLHLSGKGDESSWLVELVAHQSSLPLALAILYQNYRFAFADLFLKRAISLLLIALVAFGLYVLVAAPLLGYHETHDRNDVQAVSLLITLWIATALIYPAVHRFSSWFVDAVVLKRPDYAELQASIAAGIDRASSIEEVLNIISLDLKNALTAETQYVKEVEPGPGGTQNDLVLLTKDGARVYIPTTDEPAFAIEFESFRGGRTLLSDETSMLEGVALLTSRRIDAMRIAHERFNRERREQEFSKLATEAQLAALRAQINPHFLFNALTTIGYLIQTSPDKAVETLFHLTKLLRGVLNASSEFSTVAEELKLIESYLDIEKARFEERLEVDIDVPAALNRLAIPALILQPLVENAIKHAISENKNGGRVKITATLVIRDSKEFLEFCVADSGPGTKGQRNGSSTGIGLQNVRERLRSHYGSSSSLVLETDTVGTEAKITVPVTKGAVTLS
ncbi:MAG TPA: histidine kinase, partial [Pyrinomonadaceae bacterium]|nr:histidine kinase [Pyrinomonadaceae bacterium]